MSNGHQHSLPQLGVGGGALDTKPDRIFRQLLLAIELKQKFLVVSRFQ
jgi:hypothetical protein